MEIFTIDQKINKKSLGHSRWLIIIEIQNEDTNKKEK